MSQQMAWVIEHSLFRLFRNTHTHIFTTHTHTNLISGPQLFLFSHLTQVAIRAAPMDAVGSVYTLTGAQLKLFSCRWLSYWGEN